MLFVHDGGALSSSYSRNNLSDLSPSLPEGKKSFISQSQVGTSYSLPLRGGVAASTGNFQFVAAAHNDGAR